MRRSASVSPRPPPNPSKAAEEGGKGPRSARKRHRKDAMGRGKEQGEGAKRSRKEAPDEGAEPPPRNATWLRRLQAVAANVATAMHVAPAHAAGSPASSGPPTPGSRPSSASTSPRHCPAAALASDVPPSPSDPPPTDLRRLTLLRALHMRGASPPPARGRLGRAQRATPERGLLTRFAE